MLDLLFLALLTAWSAGLGLAILARSIGVPENRCDALGLAVPLGLGSLSLAAFALGEIGALGRGGLLLILGLGAVPASLALRRFTRSIARPSVPSDLPSWIFDAALIATVLGTLLTALSPVTDGDALCYHLQVPKIFLHDRAMTFEPDLHETAYPLVVEMLYAVALAFRGPVACRLVQWVLGLAFAANVAAIARPVLGDRARWAGTIALLTPAISNGMGAPLNDVALAAFGNAALAALVVSGRVSTRSAALSGVLAGMAIGVKYPGLVWAAVLGGSLLGRGRGFRPFVAFAACTLLVGGGWYLRAYGLTGNPVHPFFRGIFGSGIDDVLDPIKRPMAVSPWNLLTALGPMTLDPDRFDSLAHQFGPAFLLFLPGLLLLGPPRRVVGVVLLGFAFLTTCLCVRQSMRFVLTAVGPMAVGVAWAASAWWDRRGVPGRVLVGILALILAFEATIAVGRARHGIGVVLGRETAESFLDRREPTYRVGRWIAANLPADARIVGQDHRGFYLPRPYTMELAHRRRTGLTSRGESAEEVVDHLRRQGFTHLMLCPPVPEAAVEFDPTLSRRLAPWLSGHSPTFREAISDADGVTRLYSIYDLDAPAEVAAIPGARR